LAGTARATRHRERDRLGPARVSEIQRKRDICAANKCVRSGNPERCDIHAGPFDGHVGIACVRIDNRDARGRSRQRGGDRRLSRAAVVLQAHV
jgi:hypothetical protein